MSLASIEYPATLDRFDSGWIGIDVVQALK